MCVDNGAKFRRLRNGFQMLINRHPWIHGEQLRLAGGQQGRVVVSGDELFGEGVDLLGGRRADS